MTKRILKGTVVQDKSDKTVVVSVKRKFSHPFYKKVITTPLFLNNVRGILLVCDRVTKKKEKKI